MPKKIPPGQLKKVITEKKIITFNYGGYKRTCEPHVLGIANGRQQLLCWQLSGGTVANRGGIPQWRRFDIEDIIDFKITERTFPGKRLVSFPHSKWDQILLTV